MRLLGLLVAFSASSNPRCLVADLSYEDEYREASRALNVELSNSEWISRIGCFGLGTVLIDMVGVGLMFTGSGYLKITRFNEEVTCC